MDVNTQMVALQNGIVCMVAIKRAISSSLDNEYELQ